MTISTHLAISGAVLVTVPDPTLAIVVVVALHPLLDALPHAEITTFINQERREIWKAALLTAIDLLVAGYVIGRLSILPLAPTYLIGGLLAGFWMDWLQPLVGRFWPGFVRAHVWIHSWPQSAVEPINWHQSFTGRVPTWIKLILQAALTWGAISLLHP